LCHNNDVNYPCNISPMFHPDNTLLPINFLNFVSIPRISTQNCLDVQDNQVAQPLKFLCLNNAVNYPCITSPMHQPDGTLLPINFLNFISIPRISTQNCLDIQDNQVAQPLEYSYNTYAINYPCITSPILHPCINPIIRYSLSTSSISSQYREFQLKTVLMYKTIK
jgi:hypothetical protein